MFPVLPPDYMAQFFAFSLRFSVFFRARKKLNALHNIGAAARAVKQKRNQ